jgi:hypothetical protein
MYFLNFGPGYILGDFFTNSSGHPGRDEGRSCLSENVSIKGVCKRIRHGWQLKPRLPDSIFRPKIPIWVIFGRFCNRRCWYISWSFGLFYGHLVYFKAIWYILGPFGLLYQEKSGNPGWNACDHGWTENPSQSIEIVSRKSSFFRLHMLLCGSPVMVARFF